MLLGNIMIICEGDYEKKLCSACYPIKPHGSKVHYYNGKIKAHW